MSSSCIADTANAASAEVEPLHEPAYLYDGTLEGLLSAVFLAYERKETPLDIMREEGFEPRFMQSVIAVQTDMRKAMRVRNGLVRECGKRAFTAVKRASTCEGSRVGAVIYRFIRFAMARPPHMKGKPIMSMLAIPEVGELASLEKKALNEAERMRQFVRFSKLENGLWFARVHPNASVVPLVMGHFASRLNDQPFVIYDERHHVAGVYDGRRWSLVSGEAAIPARESQDELVMKEAWKRFYDALSIDPRYNPELRRHFMPVRLWNDLPEMHPREED